MFDRLQVWLVAALALVMFMVSAIVESLVMLESRVTYLTAPRQSVGRLRARAESLFTMLTSMIRDSVADIVHYSAQSDSALYSSGRRHASMLT